MHDSWDRTVDEHRSAQREAIASAAWGLAEQHGPLSLTMSLVARAAGVSRPTLYKYFPDVESMLRAHHQQHVEGHLAELTAIVESSANPCARLDRLAHMYARICHERASHSDPEVARLVHSSLELDNAESQVRALFAKVIRDVGVRRDGLNPLALASYCVRALAAAAEVPPQSIATLARLVVTSVTFDQASTNR